MSRDLGRKDWQVAARRQVGEALEAVLQASRVQAVVEVLLVWNNTSRRNTTGPTRYFAKLASVALSRKVRDAFSGFFRQNNPLVRPHSLTNVSIRNKITLASRVRIAIMRQLGQNYKDKNPGASFAVKGFESRPQLTIFPPSAARDARQRSMFFVEAVTTLPSAFSDEQLLPFFRIIGSNFKGQLEATFIVLRDDDHDRLLTKLRESDQNRRQAFQHEPRPGGSQVVGPAMSYSGVVHQLGAGADVNAGVARLLSQPPPPPPPNPPAEVESPSVHGSPHHRSQRSSPSRRRSPSRRSKHNHSASSGREKDRASSRSATRRSKRHRSASSGRGQDRPSSRRRRQSSSSSSSSSSSTSSSNES